MGDYLLGAIVLVGIGMAIWISSLTKGKAIAERDRKVLVDEIKRRKKTERIDSERDNDHRSVDHDRLRDAIERERLLRERSKRKDSPS